MFLGVPVAAARQGGEVVITGGEKDKTAFDADSDAFFQLLRGKGASPCPSGNTLADGWFGELFPGAIFRSGKLKGDVCIVSGKGKATHLYMATHVKGAGPFSQDLPDGSGGRILLGASALGLSLALLWVLVFLGRGGIGR